MRTRLVERKRVTTINLIIATFKKRNNRQPKFLKQSLTSPVDDISHLSRGSASLSLGQENMGACAKKTKQATVLRNSGHLQICRQQTYSVCYQIEILSNSKYLKSGNLSLLSIKYAFKTFFTHSSLSMNLKCQPQRITLEVYRNQAIK